jgi:acyl carrier protein
MQNTKEDIEAILVSMGLTDIAFNLPIKKQIDSIDLTGLIIAVEDEWNISITDEDRDELVTFDDLIKLVHLKTQHMTAEVTEKAPTIDEQIQFIEDFVIDPVMMRAIKENLIAVRLMMHTSVPLHLQSSTMSGNDVEPPFNHPAGL